MKLRIVPIVIFLVALLGSGAWLAEIQPFAIVPLVREKFAWFAGHADDYDTLFIGTSRVYRGIKPAVFDELTAAAGVPTHSFNIAVDGMTPPEDAYVFERLNALRPKHLRWVFIETNTIRTGLGDAGEVSVRGLHWHDATRSMIVLRNLLAPPGQKLRWKKVLFGSAEEREPMTHAITHAGLWFTRTLNAGRGAFFFQSWLRPVPEVPLETVLGEAGDGFMPAGKGLPMTGDDLRDYQRRARKPSHVSFLDRDAQQSLDGMLAQIGALGARPILLIPPSVGRGRQYPQAGCPATVLDYGEMEKWPALFQVEHRVDRGHLNAAGADVFTRAVAADFIHLVESSR